MSISQAIKYEGDNSTFVWKHPVEDFNYGTQLIVHESQEAIFFMNGQALDLFGPGRHTLETQNIPLIRRLFNAPTNGNTPFHCEVYFINKTEQMGIPWGMSSKINYSDPHYNNYSFPIGASGSMNLRIVDARKLLVKVVGTAQSLSQLTLKGFLNAPLQTKIKTFLSKVLAERAYDVYGLDQYHEEFSYEMQSRLAGEFADYGVEVSKFWIETILMPEDDPVYKQIKQLKGDVITKPWEANIAGNVRLINAEIDKGVRIKEAEALKASRDIQGIDYRTEQGAEIAKFLAQNQGIGNFSNAGIGLGMMAGMAGPISDIANQYVNDFLNSTPTAQPSPESYGVPPMVELRDDNTFSNTNNGMSDFDIRLAKLEKLKGRIPDDMYNAKMKELLDSI